MLILTRREGEVLTLSPSKYIDPDMTVRELFAGGPITIEVIQSGSQTKLGIDALRDSKVLRLELSSEHIN